MLVAGVVGVGLIVTAAGLLAMAWRFERETTEQLIATETAVMYIDSMCAGRQAHGETSKVPEHYHVTSSRVPINDRLVRITVRVVWQHDGQERSLELMTVTEAHGKKT